MIQHNTPIEATREKYLFFKVAFAGIVAHRQEKGRYWIKWMWPGYREEVERVLSR